MGIGKGNHPASRANLKEPWKPGQAGPGAGTRSAGATIKEWANQMAGYNRERLRAVAKDPKTPVAKVAAARWLLRAASNRTGGQGTPIADKPLNQLVSHTDGSPHKTVAVNVTGGLTHALQVRAAMDKLRESPEAMEQAERLGQLLYDGDGGSPGSN